MNIVFRNGKTKKIKDEKIIIPAFQPARGEPVAKAHVISFVLNLYYDRLGHGYPLQECLDDVIEELGITTLTGDKEYFQFLGECASYLHEEFPTKGKEKK